MPTAAWAKERLVSKVTAGKRRAMQKRQVTKRSRPPPRGSKTTRCCRKRARNRQRAGNRQWNQVSPKPR